jgi:hypothetical protein
LKSALNFKFNLNGFDINVGCEVSFSKFTFIVQVFNSRAKKKKTNFSDLRKIFKINIFRPKKFLKNLKAAHFLPGPNVKNLNFEKLSYSIRHQILSSFGNHLSIIHVLNRPQKNTYFWR